MIEAKICAVLCAPQIPRKDYSDVIGELAHFLPSCTQSSGLYRLFFLFFFPDKGAEGYKELIYFPLIISDPPGKVGLHVGSPVLLL